MAFTDKQAAFIQEYLKDKNATQAAIRAGYSRKNADKIGPELLGKTRIRAEINAQLEKAAHRNMITVDNIIEELAKGAFHSMEADHKYYLHKMKALEMLCKHLGILDGSGAKKSDSETYTDRLSRIIGKFKERSRVQQGDSEGSV